MKMSFSAIPDSGAVRLNLLTGLSLKPHRRCRRWHKPAHETLQAATRRRHTRAPISRLAGLQPLPSADRQYRLGTGRASPPASARLPPPKKSGGSKLRNRRDIAQVRSRGRGVQTAAGDNVAANLLLIASYGRASIGLDGRASLPGTRRGPCRSLGSELINSCALRIRS